LKRRVAPGVRHFWHGGGMQEAFQGLQMQSAGLFAAVILLVVFFLIARVANARQLVALAFATMPLLIVWAAQGAFV
jgi:hypothetical protein